MEVRPAPSSARNLGYGIVDGGSEDLNPSFPAEIKIRVNSGGSFVGFGKFQKGCLPRIPTTLPIPDATGGNILIMRPTHRVFASC